MGAAISFGFLTYQRRKMFAIPRREVAMQAVGVYAYLDAR